jgi:hypothetical protein
LKDVLQARTFIIVAMLAVISIVALLSWVRERR